MNARIAIAWYSEIEYAKFLKYSDDPETWDRDYKSWRKKAEKLIKRCNKQKCDVVKVSITVREIEEYCARQGKQNMAASRSALAAEKARLMDEENTGG